MKLAVLAALIAAVTCGHLSEKNNVENPTWPWQVGKLYRYDVKSYTLARLQEGASTGNAFKAHFIVRVTAPNRLYARLENSQHADVHQSLHKDRLPSDLKYQPVKELDKPFEITLEGGRVRSLNAPASLSLSHENLLKGLISALQVDLSAHHHNEHSPRNTYDMETKQGQFKRMETDVTGDCETLYTVSPVGSNWRQELPNFSLKEDPIEITKSKNYDHCHHRVAYNFGVPQGAKWSGIAQKYYEKQFISRSTTSRFLVDGQAIYKAETTSTVSVHPHLYGKQKAEVLSTVKLSLTTYEDDKEPEWQKSEESREIKSLLFAVTKKQNSIRHYSSSSESHEHKQVKEEHESHSRVRRSPKSKVISINKVFKTRMLHNDGSSWEESREADLYADVNDKVPLMNEPAFEPYLDSEEDMDTKQNPAIVQKLVQELAQQMQNPNNMPKNDFLSKFNILVSLISSMSLEQLNQASRSIESAKSSNNVVKTDMWMIYRDAVAQSGSFPAFQQIQSWIQKKTIQGEEAAEIVASLVRTLRYPTKEIMIQFFKLAMSPEVREQQFLNTTALIAATRFINMGQVNNYTAHYLYPTHMYGRLADKYDSFVLEEILPPLAHELEKAVQQKDSSKAQVYIKAIGNLGHRQILVVFAPYLEGKIPVSTYLRTLIINNLQVLSLQNDKYARNVLYSLLKNTAEPYEVRVAAIRKIFIALPNQAMIQAMAQMTHNDPSKHVRSALKTSIETVAKWNNPQFRKVSNAAEAVRPMLTKEKFAEEYTARNDYYDRENGFDFTDVFSYTSSEDNLFPRHLKYSVTSKTSDWNEISASFSSVQQFLDYFQQQMDRIKQQTPRSEPNHKYSANKISELLKIKHDRPEPLEGDFNINFMQLERYFTFNEDDLNKLPNIIRDHITNLKQGIEKHYTKVLNQAQVSVMFPTAMGMPFIYKYKEPTILHIQGNVKGDINLKNQQDFSGSVQKEIQITYARNIDGSVGFYDTLVHKHASVGVVNKAQLYIPVKVDIQMKQGEVKIHLEPLRPEQDTTIAHYSVWPYSTSQKKGSLVPVSQEPATKIFNRNNKVNSVDHKFGQTAGTQFQFQGYSYSKDYTNFASLFHYKGLLFNIANILYQRDIATTHYNFRYLGKQSSSKGVTVTAAYDAVYNQKQSNQEPFIASKVRDTTPNSAGRREEMAKRVVSGINTANAHVVDLSASFDGPQKAEYALTFAIGQSPVDRKIQYAVFAGRNLADKQYQINAAVTSRRPEVTALNFVESLKKDLKMNFDAEIKFGDGEEGSVEIQGHTDRSQKYTEELQKYPLAQQALEEIANNNYYQKASHKMLVMAHAPDYFKASVTYKNVSPAFKYMIFQAYRLAEGFGFWYSDVNPLKTLPDGKIELEAQTSYMDNLINLMLKSRYGEVKVKNVPIPESTVNVVSAYSPFKLSERIANYYTHHQYQPFCTVDDNQIYTFSKRNYNYKLTSSWHVVVQNAPRSEKSHRADQLVVLARKPSEMKQEIYISYQSETGRDLEIEIKPTKQGERQESKKHDVKVKTNSKKISDGDLTMYWDDVDNTPFLEYYTQPDGVLILNIREDRLRAMYDGQRLVVLANDYRNDTRGICGYMNGEPHDDYMTPNGLVDRPEHYGASYALNVEYSDPQTQQLQSQAKEVAYQRRYKKTNILRSDKNWQESMDVSSSEEDRESDNVYRSRGYSKQVGSCQLQQQVQYYENHGEICISIAPMNACHSRCQGKGYSVKSYQVVCRPKLDQQFQEYRNQIHQGHNPKVNGATELKQYRVPSSCKA